MASGFLDSWLSVIASPLSGVVSLGSLCWRSTKVADHACIVARVGSLSGTCTGMAARVVVAAVATVLKSCAPPPVYAGFRGGPCACSGWCCWAAAGPRSCEG